VLSASGLSYTNPTSVVHSVISINSGKTYLDIDRMDADYSVGPSSTALNSKASSTPYSGDPITIALSATLASIAGVAIFVLIGWSLGRWWKRHCRWAAQDARAATGARAFATLSYVQTTDPLDVSVGLGGGSWTVDIPMAERQGRVSTSTAGPSSSKQPDHTGADPGPSGTSNLHAAPSVLDAEAVTDAPSSPEPTSDGSAPERSMDPEAAAEAKRSSVIGEESTPPLPSLDQLILESVETLPTAADPEASDVPLDGMPLPLVYCTVTAGETRFMEADQADQDQPDEGPETGGQDVEEKGEGEMVNSITEEGEGADGDDGEEGAGVVSLHLCG
jgi:hypothetical protein